MQSERKVMQHLIEIRSNPGIISNLERDRAYLGYAECEVNSVLCLLASVSLSQLSTYERMSSLFSEDHL